jgi:hypothetical protein
MPRHEVRSRAINASLNTHHNGVMTMKLASTLATALLAGSLPLFASAAVAAPLAQGKALTNADLSTVEQVQYRRWRSGRWIGPAAGVAAGVAIGSAIAPRTYDDGYGAYAAAPGFAAAPGYRVGPSGGYAPQYGSCTGDRDSDAAFPSWACR